MLITPINTDASKPTSKGLNPTFFIFFKSVFNPTLTITMTINNLANHPRESVIDDGMLKTVLMIATPTNTKIN